LKNIIRHCRNFLKTEVQIEHILRAVARREEEK
jgi:hypothetical protein